ncbi:heme A synthase [Erythrobacter arachoides]|uniref:Heme A synthase n=1 Tax=Aurantiacibacter arachoides TaxID=1850444 RepID=A0A845A3B8_9SPHN|nr:COX15/CtaA family protein [Aurantiacibacter arachoides]MXO94615.1 heme A synthase [Aurantiacibacter arachoides]GGD62078.1 heme A synthase [Aurantiacibacter arachoides]
MSALPTASDTANRERPRSIAVWLFVCAVLVLTMVAVGGITRLTESGLSITQWKPITGAIPPLSQADWQAEFDLYKATGEYRNVTGPAGMDLDAFKFIFFWEWFHRFLGRLLGLAFALPLAWFWVRRAIPAGYTPRLVALLALGGLQGAFGWFMVRSGLSGEMTDVSHFWLSIHLLTALFTLAGLVWTALDLRQHAQGRTAPSRLTRASLWVAAILFVQLLLGAWVAGLNAGLVSDTWPLMFGRLVPEANWANGVAWTFLHDPFWLHFLHRWWAFVAAAALVVLARRVRPLERRASIAINAMVGTQILLGIATVMSGVALWLAVAHQLVGALLVASFAWGAHVVGRREPEFPRAETSH